MGKEAKRNDQKNTMMESFMQWYSETYNVDVLRVGPSEIAIPAVDENGEEFFHDIKWTIPRGTRNGLGGYNAYDGYAAAEAYAAELAAKEAEKVANAAKKEREATLKAERRQVKKAIKNLEQAVS